MNKDNNSASDITEEHLINIIHHSKIFSEIDRKACLSLLRHLERMTLAQGEVLFNQYDSSDCLYILAVGQLTCSLISFEGKQKIVGIVDQGETVGELGAISSEPRSLSARASTDCVLLKLPREEFNKFAQENPKFVLRIVDLIVNRSQNTLKLLSKRKIYEHIAIIQGNEQTSMETFIANLHENFIHDEKFVLLDHLMPDDDIGFFITQIEEAHKNAIFFLSEKNINMLGNKLNHIGGIFVVANGDAKVKLSNFALKMLKKAKTPFATQFELVLLHDDNLQMPQHTDRWLTHHEFTLHHHIRMTNAFDYQRLIRFMKGKAIGLVLGGGGTKGWVEVGALKALLESKVPIDAIGAASVGAVVGACYVITQDYDKLYQMFRTIINSVLKPFSIKQFTWPVISLLSAKRPTHTIHELFGEIKIENLWLPYFSISTNLSTGKEAVHRRGVLWESLRASAALPGIVPPMIMEGELHFDGGLLNNLPVDCMRTMLGDDSIIIAVSLTETDKKIERYHFPPIISFRIGLMRKLKLGYHDYSFPPLLNTFIQALLVGSSMREQINRAGADVLIMPDLSKYPSFEVNLEKIDELIEIGYSEMKAKIHASPVMKDILL